jgi:hypothetical protein
MKLERYKEQNVVLRIAYLRLKKVTDLPLLRSFCLSTMDQPLMPG